MLIQEQRENPFESMCLAHGCSVIQIVRYNRPR